MFPSTQQTSDNPKAAFSQLVKADSLGCLLNVITTYPKLLLISEPSKLFSVYPNAA